MTTVTSIGVGVCEANLFDRSSAVIFSKHVYCLDYSLDVREERRRSRRRVISSMT
jgi:hypothetical protein